MQILETIWPQKFQAWNNFIMPAEMGNLNYLPYSRLLMLCGYFRGELFIYFNFFSFELFFKNSHCFSATFEYLTLLCTFCATELKHFYLLVICHWYFLISWWNKKILLPFVDGIASIHCRSLWNEYHSYLVRLLGWWKLKMMSMWLFKLLHVVDGTWSVWTLLIPWLCSEIISLNKKNHPRSCGAPNIATSMDMDIWSRGMMLLLKSMTWNGFRHAMVTGLFPCTIAYFFASCFTFLQDCYNKMSQKGCSSICVLQGFPVFFWAGNYGRFTRRR